MTHLVSDLVVIKPAYLVIDMGSNDLGRQHALQSVDNLALELVMKVLQAIEIAQISPPSVIFLEQLKRSKTHSSWVVGTRQYNRQVERFNIEVNRAAKQRYCPLSSVRVSFFRYRRMRLNWPDHLCQDGVHLNEAGHNKYMRNLKGALLH